jgi:hypothetical protein
MLRVLDAAIEIAGANKGTLQRIDERNNRLKITASRGLSDAFLKYLETVYPDTNTSCAAAMMRRMRVVVSDVSTSYLYVGTPELEILRLEGVSASHSTPIMSGAGRFSGVFMTHFNDPLPLDRYNPEAIDLIAARLAEHLERLETGRD